MRKFSILATLFMVFALVLAACGTGQGSEGNNNGFVENGNTFEGAYPETNLNGDLNGNGDFNTNEDLNGNTNMNEALNGNANLNGDMNANGNLNANDNFNTNLNGNLNANDNFNTNVNGNLNANDNFNTNLNGNMNANDNMNANLNGNENINGSTGVQPPLPATGAAGSFRVTELMDYDVYNQAGEQVGEVEDVVLDLSGQRVAYFIVEVDGRTIPVPCEAMQFRGEATDAAATDFPENALILLVDETLLETVPEIDLEDFQGQGMLTEGWGVQFDSWWETNGGFVPGGSMNGNANMNGSFSGNENGDMNGNANASGAQPGVMATTAPITGTTQITGSMGLRGAVLASEFVGMAVTTGTEEEVGVIEDVIIDQASCQVRFIVLDADVDGEDRLIPVPVMALSWDATTEGFIFVVDPGLLDAAPYFEDGLFSDWSVPDWDVDYLEYWRPYMPTGTY
jgi:sporulation protein YlmC with PRC-barrel domain